MKLNTLLLGLIFSLFSMLAVAGSGHSHGHGHSHEPVNQSTANAKAAKIVKNFIKQNTIDKSWASASLSSSEKKLFNGKQEWVVTFDNNKMADTKKRKLYIFLTLSGNYIAANYTGK